MKARRAAESSISTLERRPSPGTVVSFTGLRAGLTARRASVWRRASSISCVSDWPVSWAKRLADLRSWSSRRIVVRTCQNICMWHQYVNLNGFDGCAGTQDAAFAISCLAVAHKSLLKPIEELCFSRRTGSDFMAHDSPHNES